MLALHEHEDAGNHVSGDDEVLGVEGVMLDAEGQQLEDQVQQLHGARIVVQRLVVGRVRQQRRCRRRKTETMTS